MRLSTRPDRQATVGLRASCPAEGRFATPWGEGRVAVWGGRLVGVELPPLGCETDTPLGGSVSALDHKALQWWVDELEAYFRGERMSWRPEDIDLEAQGLSSFARRTVEALLRVPPGETVSYGELAQLAGYPRAARAVGTVMASNPIPIVVPCHRVIRSDGSLGKYGTDERWKDRLLSHERSNVTKGADRHDG